MSINSRSSAELNVDSEDCNQSKDSEIKYATSVQSNTHDGDGNRKHSTIDGARKRSVRSKEKEKEKQEIVTLKELNLKFIKESQNETVQNTYRDMFLMYHPEQFKKQERNKVFLPPPVANNVKENKKIRKSVIGDYLLTRRHSQAKVSALVLNRGFSVAPNVLRRPTPLEQKGPNIFRKSFLEQNNPLYPEAADIQKNTAVVSKSKLPIGSTDMHMSEIVRKLVVHTDNDGGESGENTKIKSDRRNVMDELETINMPLDMLDRLDFMNGDNVAEGGKNEHVTVAPKEQIKESEQFFQKLKKEMASTPLKVRNKKIVKLEDERPCQQICNGKNCTVPETKSRCSEKYPWLI